MHFDPKVLDAFGKIARDLYDRYGGHEGEDLKAELTAVVGGLLLGRHGNAQLRVPRRTRIVSLRMSNFPRRFML